MAGFTKLFSSIVDSTIWREDPYTKVVWVTMLAKADKNGIVNASVPGLADASRVNMDQCKKALSIFLSPDPYSRSTDFEGRRIMEIEGGWILLNYIKYRKIQDEDQTRIATLERVRKHREKIAQTNIVTDVTDCNERNVLSRDVTPVTKCNVNAEAEAEAEAITTTPTSLAPSSKQKRSRRTKDEIFKPFSPEVKEVVNVLVKEWRRNDPSDGRVITISPASFGSRIKEILEQHKDINKDILIQSGRDYCKTDRQRYKAPQYFFGPEGPWKDFVNGIITIMSKEG